MTLQSVYGGDCIIPTYFRTTPRSDSNSIEYIKDLKEFETSVANQNNLNSNTINSNSNNTNLSN